VLQDDWKLIVPLRRGGAVQLYNLGEDPAEKKNLAGENADKVAELRGVLENQRKLDLPLVP
jgi:hypothetical protein